MGARGYGRLWPIMAACTHYLLLFSSFSFFTPFALAIAQGSRGFQTVYPPLFSSTIFRSMRIVSTKRTPINIYNYVYVLIKERISNFAYPRQLNNSLGLEIHGPYASFILVLCTFIVLRRSSFVSFTGRSCMRVSRT